MIDFLNEHLQNLNINTSSLYPIYVDDVLIINHIDNFNDELIDHLQDYYLSKNNINIIYYDLTDKAPSVKYDSKDFVFIYTNLKNKRSIVVSSSKDKNFATIEFYLNINNGKINYNTKLIGTIFVMSNFVNNGISVQLLDVLYQYLENEHFDEQNLFCNVLIN